jgi:hypothetical protein
MLTKQVDNNLNYLVNYVANPIMAKTKSHIILIISYIQLGVLGFRVFRV